MTANVRIIHGANDGDFPLVGHTVLAAKNSLREVFNIPYFAEATINGASVNVDCRLQGGDTLEFIQPFGFKGGGDANLPERQAEGLLRKYPGLQKIAEEVKASETNVTDAINVMHERVEKWFEDTFGPVVEPINVTLQMLLEKINRMSQSQKPNEITDGPTPWGDLWYKGNLFALGLTQLEYHLLNALWKSRQLRTDDLCEQVYGGDELREGGLKDVKKRLNARLRKGGIPLEVKLKNDVYILKSTDVADPAANE